MTVRAIVAMDAANGGIGYKGDIPWILPGDMQHFKTMTMGQTILMGVRTAHSLGKALPGRINLVVGERRHTSEVVALDLTANEFVANINGASSEEIISGHGDVVDIWVIGGADTYARYAEHITEWYVTLVHAPRSVRYDTYLDHSLFETLAKESMVIEGCGYQKDQENSFPVEYRRYVVRK